MRVPGLGMGSGEVSPDLSPRAVRESDGDQGYEHRMRKWSHGILVDCRAVAGPAARLTEDEVGHVVRAVLQLELELCARVRQTVRRLPDVDELLGNRVVVQSGVAGCLGDLGAAQRATRGTRNRHVLQPLDDARSR